jgi:hypothetical protein
MITRGAVLVIHLIILAFFGAESIRSDLLKICGGSGLAQ